MSILKTTVRARGADRAEVEGATAAAKASCPISKVLKLEIMLGLTVELQTFDVEHEEDLQSLREDLDLMVQRASKQTSIGASAGRDVRNEDARTIPLSSHTILEWDSQNGLLGDHTCFRLDISRSPGNRFLQCYAMMRSISRRNGPACLSEMRNPKVAIWRPSVRT